MTTRKYVKKSRKTSATKREVRRDHAFQDLRKRKGAGSTGPRKNRN